MVDHDILDAFFRRDAGAISEMEQTYTPYCKEVVRYILDNPLDVEEILNDTWLRAWNSIPPQRPENLKLYLARIARNLAFDRFRSSQRIKRGNGEISIALSELSFCLSGGPQPDAILEAKDLHTQINCFLKKLPRRERIIFVKRYFYTQPFDNIAKDLGCTPAIIRATLSRTRRKLKQHLVKEGFIHA